MQSITHCPVCQTQFVVTEQQLNQHSGTVRCGYCLDVFNAIEQLVNTEVHSEHHHPTSEFNALIAPDLIKPDLSEALVTEVLVTEDPITQELTTEVQTIEVQAGQHDYLAAQAMPTSATKKSPVLLWILLIVMLLMMVVQSIFFLRHQISLYYPNIKPSLVLACEKIGCSIDLPKKIELILIDDSDIQEDAEHTGVMRLSTTLINQAGFYQAYPNLELTLTDVDDKPKLRRIFKPIEYLPAKTNIAFGLAAGAAVKVNVAMTTQGIAVTGYRVFVSY